MRRESLGPYLEKRWIEKDVSTEETEEGGGGGGGRYHKEEGAREVRGVECCRDAK